MNATRLTVSRILQLGIRVTWREAGAIAYETLRLSREREASGAAEFAIDTVVLTRGGDVVFLDGGGAPPAEAIADLVAALVAACEAPDRLGMALASGHIHTFLDELGEKTDAKRRRVEIAAVALRGLAAEAERALAQPDMPERPAPNRRPPWEPAVGAPFEPGRRPSGAQPSQTHPSHPALIRPDLSHPQPSHLQPSQPLPSRPEPSQPETYPREAASLQPFQPPWSPPEPSQPQPTNGQPFQRDRGHAAPSQSQRFPPPPSPPVRPIQPQPPGGQLFQQLQSAPQPIQPQPPQPQAFPPPLPQTRPVRPQTSSVQLFQRLPSAPQPVQSQPSAPAPLQPQAFPPASSQARPIQPQPSSVQLFQQLPSAPQPVQSQPSALPPPESQPLHPQPFPPRQFTRVATRPAHDAWPSDRPARDVELFRGTTFANRAREAKSRRWLWVVAGAFLAVAVGLGLWLWTRTPPPHVTGPASKPPAVDRGASLETRPAAWPPAPRPRGWRGPIGA
jgi:hypothetical protein